MELRDIGPTIRLGRTSLIGGNLERKGMSRGLSILSFRMSTMEIEQPEGSAPEKTGRSGGEVPPEDKENEATMESHKIRDGAIKVLALGDSHLREKHHFPGLYEQAQKEKKMDPRYGPLERMTAWEEKDSGFAPGYLLNEEYKGQVLDLIEERRGKATAFIISLGTNDIRENYEKTTVRDLLKRYQAIVNKVKETPGVALLIVEPIPCNKVAPGYRNWLDRELMTMCHQDEKLRYVTLSRGKEPALTEVDGRLWQKKLWEDQIHLNKEGAKYLIKAVLNGLNQIRSETFLVDPKAREPRKNWRKRAVEVDSTKGKPKAWRDRRLGRIDSGRVIKRTGKFEGKGAKAPRRTSPEQRRSGRGGERRSPNSPPARQGKGPDYYREKRAEALRRYQNELEEIEKEERAEKAGRSAKDRLGYGVSTPRRHQDERRSSRGEDGDGSEGIRGYGGGAGLAQPMPFYPFGTPWIPNPYYRQPQ